MTTPPPAVAVFGADGWIGGMLAPELEAVGLSVVRAPVRADDAAGVRAFLRERAPLHGVVCLVGRTHGPGCATIDFLEDDPGSHDKLAVALRDNLYAPVTLALACRELGVHLTYVGTGCVFEYPCPHGDAGFGPDDEPNFFGSTYSVVKGFTDRIMRQLADGVLQARIRMPITADRSPRNFVTKIVGYDRVCSVPNSMSVLPTLLPLLADMVRRRVVGTVNLVNPGTITHDRVLELYKLLVDPDKTWTNMTVAEQDAVLRARRSNNRLDTSALEAMYPQVPHVEDAVAECMRRLHAL